MPRERNKRREGLVKGAPTAQGIFSLSVTRGHAAHLPFRYVELESARLKAASKKRQVRADWGTATIDPVPGRCLVDVRSGSVGDISGPCVDVRKESGSGH